MKSRSRILRGVAAKRVVVPRFNIDEWSKPTMSSVKKTREQSWFAGWDRVSFLRDGQSFGGG